MPKLKNRYFFRQDVIKFGPILFAGVILFCNSGNNSSMVTSPDIKLPPGFEISVYSDNVPGARSMTLSENGILFIGTRVNGKVYAVLDTNGDYTSDEVVTIADGLNMPNGVAIKDGNLYVAEVNRILKFNDIENNFRDNPEPEVLRDDLPNERHHGWKFIRFGPDGKLYVPVGAPCNCCLSEDQRFASILRMNPDGTALELFASGVRNTVGFDFHPQTGELWFTDNGRDMLGDNIPPDELNRVQHPGQHFGFPFWHGKSIPDPEFGAGHSADEFSLPVQELGPHVAALGMRFYTGSMFPGEYRNQIFIAEHGSWNRSEKIGYRVMIVKIEDGNPVSYELFAYGWLKGESVSGRPVDIQQMPDGSLLVSDDFGGVIYRISYKR